VAYYKASLLYLACINLDEQAKEDLVSRAHDLSIAALLGETTYNFGELVSNGGIHQNSGKRDAHSKSLVCMTAATSIVKRVGRFAIQMAQGSSVRFQRWRYRTI
jgi:hypothetical protein